MTRSLSPYGLTTASAKARLDSAPLGENDPERIMMRLWEQVNTSDAALCQGLVPLILIAHRCNEGCKSEHAYRPIPRHDMELVAATVQWLACHSGRNFLIKFLEEIGQDVRYNPTKDEERTAARNTKYPPQAPLPIHHEPPLPL